MKTREYIGKLTTGKWTRMTVLAIAAFIVFGYLYSRGVSPGVDGSRHRLFSGFFRLLYKVACFLVAAAILFVSSVTWHSDSTGIKYRKMEQIGI